MIKIEIDQKTCTRCSRCIPICPVRIFTQEEKKGDISLINLQSCLICGHCVAICPTDSIIHSHVSIQAMHPVRKELLPSPESLLELMRKRRSNRAFSSKPIPMEYLDKILEAANLAPTAKNIRPLKYTLVTNPKVLTAVHQTCIEVCDRLYLELHKSEEEEDRRKGLYFKRLSNVYKKGYEIILRDATALILIHSEDANYAPDANLAYQNASLMAEVLNVAHFYTGYLRRLSAMDTEGIIINTMDIKGHILAGMALAMPKYTFSKSFDRDDLNVNKIL